MADPKSNGASSPTAAAPSAATPTAASAPGAKSSAKPKGKPKKPPVDTKRAWREAKALLYAHRGQLSLGLTLMLISRVAGLVLPASTKYLIDEVINKKQSDLLLPLALGAGAATLVQAITSYANSQVVSVAAQRAIMTMRQRSVNEVLVLADD